MTGLIALWHNDPMFVASLFLLSWLGYVWPVEIVNRNLLVPYLTGFVAFLGYSLIGIAVLAVFLPPLLPALLPWRLQLRDIHGSGRLPRLHVLREDRAQWLTRMYQLSIDVVGMSAGCLLHAALLDASGVLPRPFPIHNPDSLWRYLIFIISVQVVFTSCSALFERATVGRLPITAPGMVRRLKYSSSNEIFVLLFIAAGPLQYLVYFFYQVRGTGITPLLIAGTWTLLMNHAFNIWGRRGIRLTDSTRELDLARRIVRLGDDAARIVHRVRHEVALIGIGINRLRKQLDGLDAQQAEKLLVEIERLEAVRRNLQQATATHSNGNHHNDNESGNTDNSHPAAPAGNLLAAVLTRQVELLQVKALEKGVSLRLQQAQAIEHKLADPDLFGEALFNVIENAIAASRQRVDIHLCRCHSTHSAMQREEVIVTVDDDGPGLNDTAMARAFEPFFTTKPDGSGMGLVIARGAVENEQGSIHLENRPGNDGAGHGFRVTICLPASAARLPVSTALSTPSQELRT